MERYSGCPCLQQSTQLQHSHIFLISPVTGYATAMNFHNYAVSQPEPSFEPKPGYKYVKDWEAKPWACQGRHKEGHTQVPAPRAPDRTPGHRLCWVGAEHIQPRILPPAQAHAADARGRAQQVEHPGNSPGEPPRLHHLQPGSFPSQLLSLFLFCPAQNCSSTGFVLVKGTQI